MGACLLEHICESEFQPDPKPTWKIGSKEGIDQEGTFNLYVFFRKYTCKDSKWQSTDKIQSVQYKFQSAPLSEK